MILNTHFDLTPVKALCQVIIKMIGRVYVCNGINIAVYINKPNIYIYKYTKMYNK